MGKLKYYRQETSYTCGAACLRMILGEYKDYPEKVLSDLSRTTDSGVTPLGLVSAAEKLEYEVNVCKQQTCLNYAGISQGLS